MNCNKSDTHFTAFYMHFCSNEKKTQIWWRCIQLFSAFSQFRFGLFYYQCRCMLSTLWLFFSPFIKHFNASVESFHFLYCLIFHAVIAITFNFGLPMNYFPKNMRKTHSIWILHLFFVVGCWSSISLHRMPYAQCMCNVFKKILLSY